MDGAYPSANQQDDDRSNHLQKSTFSSTRNTMESEPLAYYLHSKDEPSSNDQMVDWLKSKKLITSEKSEKCLTRVDRRDFIPVECDFPYVDQIIPIGFGAWISAPSMHAFCLERLIDHIKKGANILDVGSGTGYLTTAIGVLLQCESDPETRELGHVYALEHIPELVAISKETVERHYPTISSLITFLARDGTHGLPEHAPYDCIHVGAAFERIPSDLVDQLKPGGRLICPVGVEHAQQLLVIDKRRDGSVQERVEFEGVEFPPLTSVACQLDTEAFE